MENESCHTAFPNPGSSCLTQAGPEEDTVLSAGLLPCYSRWLVSPQNLLGFSAAFHGKLSEELFILKRGYSWENHA